MNRASLYKFKAQISNYFLFHPQLLYMIRILQVIALLDLKLGLIFVEL